MVGSNQSYIQRQKRSNLTINRQTLTQPDKSMQIVLERPLTFNIGLLHVQCFVYSPLHVCRPRNTYMFTATRKALLYNYNNTYYI